MYFSQTEREDEEREVGLHQEQEVVVGRPQRKDSFKQAVRWIAITGVGLFLIWRILSLGIAEYHASRNPEQALAWDGRHSLALRNQAARLLENEPEQARRLVQAALRQNPSDARAYALLALLWEKAENPEVARQLMERASALGPRLWPVQLEAAGFWLRQRRLDRAVQGRDTALQMRGNLSEELFPILLKIAERPGLRPTLFPVARSSPSWWPNFFAYAAVNAEQLEALRALYDAKGERSPSDEERKAFVSRLQWEGQWREAYFTWLNALDEVELQAPGNLFNGYFERPLANEGFGWHFSQPRGIEIDTVSTSGVEGEQALRVAFFGRRVRFKHLFQPLLLSPGVYQLAGNVRLDNLEAALGLQWTVYCLAPAQQQLAASERFVGASLWRRFSFSFEVPEEDCSVQLLGLELLGRAPADFEARGTAWFDALAIESVVEAPVVPVEPE